MCWHLYISHHLNTSPLQPVYVLLECSHAQHLHFLLCEEAPVAAAEVLLGESCELHAVELNDAITEVFEYTAHDTVLAAVDFDAYLCLIALVSILDSICLDFTIFQSDTLTNLIHIMRCKVLVEVYVIYLLFQELRVSQLRSQVTIVGQQEYTCCVTVETTYRIDTLRAYILYEVHHSLALLRIIAGCNIILWFVEQYVYLLLQSYFGVAATRKAPTRSLTII